MGDRFWENFTWHSFKTLSLVIKNFLKPAQTLEHSYSRHYSVHSGGCEENNMFANQCIVSSKICVDFSLLWLTEKFIAGGN